MYNIKKIQRGVTLIEVLLGLFIFTLIVLSTTQLFVSSFGAKQFTQNAQKKYDLAFSALGEVGKVLSTSTLVSADTSMSGASSILVYNYSQGTCVKYAFTVADKKLKMGTASLATGEVPADCSTTINANTEVIDSFITGKFITRKLDTETVLTPEVHSGMVTIFATVYTSDPDATGSTDRGVPMQTTVSLRDYLVE